jgi:ketosteroid isomerase-like protein
MGEELVVRFFAALEGGDIDTLREIYAPDAVIWPNDDLIEQPVEENLKVLQGLHRGRTARCDVPAGARRPHHQDRGVPGFR